VFGSRTQRKTLLQYLTEKEVVEAQAVRAHATAAEKEIELSELNYPRVATSMWCWEERTYRIRIESIWVHRSRN